VWETKYAAYEAARVALSARVREIAICGLTVAEKQSGRRQLDSQRTQAAMSGKVAEMGGASGCGAEDWREAKNRRWPIPWWFSFFVFFLLVFFLIIYSLLRYKNSHAALAMA